MHSDINGSTKTTTWRKIMHYDTNLLPETGFLRLPTILKLIPIGKSSWWEGVKSGKYPKPVYIGQRVTAWRAEDVRALIEKLSQKS
jgi:prophage regulatory protein